MIKKLFFIVAITTILFGNDKLVYKLDFQGIKDTNDATKILKQKGIEFELEKDKFHFFIKDEMLYIQTSKKATVLFGKMLEKQQQLKNLSYVVIKWGVIQFPKGANWEKGNYRLPIGLVMVFGEKALPSGIGFLAPKVPTFFCPFIGEKEKINKKYLGKLYKKGGRYYCVSNEKNTLITTRFELQKRYQKEFKSPIPPLSAFAFQINTKNTQGKAKVFIKSLEFFAKSSNF
jgi:hypothetical protein